jgi:hypothetical protein
MPYQVSRERAEKRLIEIGRRIARQEAIIAQTRAQGRSTQLAEDVLGNLRRSRAIYAEHYLSLGGNLEELPKPESQGAE